MTAAGVAVLLAALTGAVTGIGSLVTAYRTSKREHLKDDAINRLEYRKLDQTEFESIKAAWRELYDEQQEQLTKMNAQLVDCNAKGLQLAAENSALRTEVADLRAHVNRLEGSP